MAYLATEEDFNYWRTQRLSSLKGETWFACVDAYSVQAILNAAGTKGAFWPLVVLAAVIRKDRMSSEPIGDRWVKVTKALLPFEPALRGRTKTAAIATLATAGLVEVRQATAKSAPELRLLYRAKVRQ